MLVPKLFHIHGTASLLRLTKSALTNNPHSRIMRQELLDNRI